MKKLIISFIFLSFNFFALAENNNSQIELLNFLKTSTTYVSKYTGDTTRWDGMWEDMDKDNLTIDDFENINSIFITDINTTLLPQNLSLLPNLLTLNIQNTNLENFVKIDSLLKLEISNVKFNELPIEIFENYKLTHLVIENSFIKEIPNEIGNLSNLNTLNLSNNELSTLPKEFGNLSNLKLLYLYNNKIQTLPQEFDNLNLTQLGLANNQLKEFSYTFKNLTYLSLANNNLKSISSGIGNSTQLSYLNLSHNKLKSLPDEIKNLVNLKEIYLNDNELKELPKGIGNICKPFKSDLQMSPPLTPCTLNVSNNKLSYLPKELGDVYGVGCGYDSNSQTPNLSFYFDNNFIDKLPSSFKKIQGVFKFYYGYKGECNKDENSFEKLGYDFYNLEIEYSFDTNKTLSFKPILGDDFEVVSYLWDFGDDFNSSEQNPTHTYLEYGDYNVTLILNTKDKNYTISKLISVKPKVIELQKGWNLITSPSKSDINTTLFSKIWSYENRLWISDKEFLNPFKGYWVKVDGDLNLSIDNSHYHLIKSKMKEGWNLVGSGEKITNFDENLTYFIYRKESWIKNPKEIEAGEGIWIKNGEHDYKEEFTNFLNENVEYFYLKDNILVYDITKDDLENIIEVGFTFTFDFEKTENMDVDYFLRILDYMPNLERFILSNSKIKEFPSELLKLTNLKSLLLFNTNIGSIPSEIKNLKNLEKLHIKGSIKEIPEAICELTKLQELSFSNNQVETLPNNLDKLINLKNLDLSYNKIEVLPNNLGNLKNLETLSLRNNPLKNIPDSLHNLKNLKDLRLDSSQIETFSSEIEGLPYR